MDEAHEEDEEINIDFSKIKKWFNKIRPGVKEKHKEVSKPEEKGKEESISLDWKDTSKFLKKYGVVFLLLIPMFLSVFFRMYPAYLPITDDWAENAVYGSIKGMIKGQVDQQYPNLPSENKDVLINEQLQVFLKENKKDVDKQIKGTSDYFKSQLQDDTGQTYLLAIDPWLWYGEARNYLKYGQFGNSVAKDSPVYPDGMEIYNSRNGRIGKPAEKKYVVNQYVQIILYKIIHIFNRDFSLISAAFLVPVLIITLSIIPAFFIGRRFAGDIGGMFAGVIVAINHSLLGRTPAGFADTDPYNIFFPLFIAWMFIESFHAKERKNMLIFGALGGLLVGLYSKAWSGWWYPFYFVLGAIAISIAYNIIINYKKIKEGIGKFFSIPPIKNSIIILILFLVVSSLSVALFTGAQDLKRGVFEPFSFMRLKEVGVRSAWPNVLTTVAEFNVAPLNQIVDSMGGKFLFIIALAGILLTLVKKDQYGKRDIMYASFLAIWFLGTTYAYTKGVRFAILMVPAFALAFGIAIGIIFQYLTKWASKELHIDMWIVKSVSIILLVLLLISPLKAAHGTAKGEIPSMNDAWYKSLTAIRDDSKDAIITSWWDFGHWFVTISERRVTFDGADQARRIHWVGKSLLVNDEKESVAILRMLNCGQELAANTLEKYLNGETNKAIHIINDIIMQDKAKAEEILKEAGLSGEQVNNITSFTHCEDLIPQYYITSQDMIGKAGVWGHFGSWDFDKATMYQKVVKKPHAEGIKILKEEFGLSENEAENTYNEIQSTKADQWVSPWPGYLTGSSGCKVDENIVRCENGLEVNLDDYSATLSTRDGKMSPSSIVYATEEGLIEKKFEGDTVPYSIALIPDGESFKSMVTDPLLAKSVFTQLFFFDGHGSKHFKKLSDVRAFDNQRIIVWKVSWEEGEPINILKKEAIYNETTKEINESLEKINVSEEEIIDNETTKEINESLEE